LFSHGFPPDVGEGTADRPAGPATGAEPGPLTAAELEEFFRRPLVARLASVRPDGAPYVVPLWFEWDETDGSFWFVIREKARFMPNIMHEPRGCLSIAADTPPYSRAGDGAPHVFGGSWHVDVVDAERRERIEDGVDYGLRRGDAAGLAPALDAEGLTVVGCSASVTSTGGSYRRVAPRSPSKSRSAGSRIPRSGLSVRSARVRYPMEEHT
jgi:hypothetical protein